MTLKYCIKSNIVSHIPLWKYCLHETHHTAACLNETDFETPTLPAFHYKVTFLNTLKFPPYSMFLTSLHPFTNSFTYSQAAI